MASILPPVTEGVEIVMKKIEERIILIEQRILRKLASILVIWMGAVFLIFALLFFLMENLGWGKAAAFFSIGITVFVIGLLLKVGGYGR